MPPEFTNDLTRILKLIPPGGIVAEVGTFAGWSAKRFLACPNVARLYCVDLWQGGYDANDGASNSDMAEAEACFDRVRLFEPRCVKVKSDSLVAAETFAAGYFDLVYLDADHRYANVIADIEAWQQKVKHGGWICGHDYGSDHHPGVKKAVDEVFGRRVKVFPYNWAVQL